MGVSAPSLHIESTDSMIRESVDSLCRDGVYTPINNNGSELSNVTALSPLHKGSKNISIKMLKDVGMIVPKTRETSAVYMQQDRR